MDDDAPGPGRGRVRMRKYAAAEVARAARNAARPNRRRQEAAMDQAASALQREQQERSTDSSTADKQKVQLGFRLLIRIKL